MTNERFIHLRTLASIITGLGAVWLLVVLVQVASIHTDIGDNEDLRKSTSLGNMTESFVCNSPGEFDPDLVAEACEKSAETEPIEAEGTALEARMQDKKQQLVWAGLVFAVGLAGLFWVYAARRLSERLAASGDGAPKEVTDPVSDRLARLERLRASSALSDAEYEQKRRQILEDL